MATTRDAFTFDYPGVTIRSGLGCVSELSNDFADRGWNRALLICGKNVGSTPAVVDPIIDGLGEYLAGIFAETTPEKTLQTVLRCVERVDDDDIGALVGLGGGSSLDIARFVSALTGIESYPDINQLDVVEIGQSGLPGTIGDSLPMIAIPTTLAGAELSIAASVTVDSSMTKIRSQHHRVGVSDRRLMPTAVYFDPQFHATTPRRILAPSAMNGFNKGVETLYSRNGTPITDATAADGVKYFRSGLVRYGNGNDGLETMGDLVKGSLLAQYGASRPGEKTLSIIHAFGHGFSRNVDVHQGIAHGVVTPHVLRYLFDKVDASRQRLAAALGIDTAGIDDKSVAAAVIATVEEVRDALGLPAQARSIPEVEEANLEPIADTIMADEFLENGPQGLDVTKKEVKAVLRRAW